MSNPDLKGVTEKKKTRKKKGFVRENLESILIAVTLAFVLRVFVVEAFKIPTGSMAPTLLGQHKAVKCPNCSWKFKSNHDINYVKCSNCSYKIRISDYGKKGGNRILVNKLAYDFGKPKRWDVAVFKYPFSDVTCLSCGYYSSQSTVCEECSNAAKEENYIKGKFNSVKRFLGAGQYHRLTCKSCKAVSIVRCEKCDSANVHVIRKNYIKRLIGLPGERLQIANGDIYINDRIVRKPPMVQESLLVPVYNSRYKARQETAEVWEARDRYWKISENQLYLKPSGGVDQESFIMYKREITDYSVYNGEITDAVNGDIMIGFDVVPTGNNGGISIILEENEKAIEAFVRLKGEKKKSYLKVSETIVENNDETFIEAGKECRIEFSNIDNRIILKLNDTVVFSHIFDTDLTSLNDYTKHSSLRFGGINTGAVFKDISIYRDVYYTDAGEWGTLNPFELGKEEYFFLGDNSRNSNDSRYWKSVPERNLVGKAFMVFWPLSTVKFVK